MRRAAAADAPGARHSHYFKPAELKVRMRQIARANRRSLVEEVNMACEEWAARLERAERAKRN